MINEHFKRSNLECTQYATSWTMSAKDCYHRGCKCEGCILNEIMETKCDMKRAVFELVRKLGAPKKDTEYTKTQQKVIDAILAGASTWEEIVKESGITRGSAMTALQDLYKIAEGNVVSYKTKRNKLSQFIEWVTENYRR